MIHKRLASLAAASCLALFGSASAWANEILTATLKGNCADYTIEVTGDHLAMNRDYVVRWMFDLRNPNGTTTTLKGTIPVHSMDDNGDFKRGKTYDWNPALADGVNRFTSGQATLVETHPQHKKWNTVSFDFEPKRLNCPDLFNELCRSRLLQMGVFGLGDGKIDLSLVTVNGNIGVYSGGTIVNMAPSTINGNVYEYVNGQYSGPGKLNGTLIEKPKLVKEFHDTAELVASQAASLTANDGTYDNITSATTISGSSGLNVVDVTGDISLNNANLTLSGGADAFFVVNIAGNMSLVGNASLVLSGGVIINHVLYNFTGSNSSINTHVGDTVNGIILAAGTGSSMTLDGAFDGALIGGGGITLMSGATATESPCKKHPCARH